MNVECDVLSLRRKKFTFPYSTRKKMRGVLKLCACTLFMKRRIGWAGACIRILVQAAGNMLRDCVHGRAEGRVTLEP